MSKKYTTRIELTQDAKNTLEKQADHAGMTQIALMSRLAEWLTSQEQTVQAAVLGRYPREIEADVARLILKRMQSR